ncbi:MAG TPA: hypothetical protein VNF73_14685 [Candidatus Saccharimonadales bacterium]|nr:hypothetical protein [Candidatus Saccharimonadales bacterium]
MTEPASDQIAWRALRYGTPVFSADGQRVGTLREVLGSDAEDILHGIRVAPEHAHRDVMVPAANLTTLTTERVETDLSLAAIEGLPEYRDEATYHLASVGWLRKHLGWKADSSSDEESH